MKLNTTHRHLMLSLLLIFLFEHGCATPAQYRINAEFSDRCENIDSYCLIKPEVEICEISSGGVREVRDDWGLVGIDNVVAALQETLTQKNVQYKRIDLDPTPDEASQQIRALYKAVSFSIRAHTYGPYAFPEKVRNFDYSIGPIDTFLQDHDCDALILVYGSDEVTTGGRKALLFFGAVVQAALTGVVTTPLGGITAVNFATIDADGQILWYNTKAGEGYDLRKKESVQTLIDQVLAQYPKCEK